MDQDLTRLTLGEMRALIASGEVSSVDLLAAALRRIAAREPQIKAWAHLDPEQALIRARAADAAQGKGNALGLLHGLPIGVKDIIDTAEFPTENGTSLDRGRRPMRDAFVVARLQAAGAIVIGKTATTELAFFSPAPTENPAAPGHTPGGSSAGSAAAVADCHVGGALGTQTAGSILRPASFCGIIGYKPTFGLVSRTGVLAQSPPLDTIGTLTRDVADAGLLAEAMMGFDAGDRDMFHNGTASLLAIATTDPSEPPKLAFVEGPAWGLVEPGAQAAYRAWCRRMSIETIALPPGSDGLLEAQRTVQFSDIARNYGPRLDAHPDRISAELTEVIEVGRAITALAYANALAFAAQQYAAMQPLFAAYDALLTPAALGPAPSGLESTGSPAANAAWTLLGVPAISLPLLEVDGRPLGVQLVSARHADARLLRTARWLMRQP